MTEIQIETREEKKMNKLLQVLRKLGTPFVAAASTIALALGVMAPMQAKAADEITFMTPAFLPETLAGFKDAVAAWNKSNPNIQVKYIQGDWENMGDKLTTQFASRTAPDVIHFEANAARLWAKQGYLADLNSLMKPLKTSIPDGSWKTASWRGRLYGVPLIDQPYVVFANVDIFKKAGVALPTSQSGFSWDEFTTLSKKMTTSTYYGSIFGVARPASPFMIMSGSFGAKWFRGVTTSKAILRVGNAELEIPTRVYNMIYKDKSMDPTSLTVRPGAAVAPFVAGKAAMFVAPSFVALDLDTAAKEKGFNWTTLPMLKGTTQNQYANPQIFSISNQSIKKKQATQFIQFLMKDENLIKFGLGDALVPMTNTALQAAIVAKKSTPGWAQLLADGGNFTVAPFSFVPEYDNWRGSVLQPALQLFLQDKISRAELVKRLEDGWKSLR